MKANRTVKLFLFLLLAFNVLLFFRPRVLTLFEATVVLNAIVLGWYVKRAFSGAKETGASLNVVRPALILLILLLNAVMFMGVYGMMDLTKHPVIALEEKAPALEWIAFDGAKHELSELSGHAVVLHFWATWCVACKQEFPKLMAFARAHPDMRFVAVDVSDQRPKAERFVAAHGDALNILYAWDPDSAISYDIFRIPSFPSSIIIDPQGRMRRKYVEPVAWGSADVAGYLEQLH